MENTKNNDSVVIPDPGHDYHGHPSYQKIIVRLFILFGVSLVVGFIFSPAMAIGLIFATAIWKSILVIKNFMHLKYEPLLIWVLVAAVLFILLMFFLGIYPDITVVPREVTPR